MQIVWNPCMANSDSLWASFRCLPRKVKNPLPRRSHNWWGRSSQFSLSYTRWQPRGLCGSHKQGIIMWKGRDCGISIGWGTTQLKLFQILCMNRFMTLENSDCIFYFEPLCLPSYINRIFPVFQYFSDCKNINICSMLSVLVLKYTQKSS